MPDDKRYAQFQQLFSSAKAQSKVELPLLQATLRQTAKLLQRFAQVRRCASNKVVLLQM